MHCVILDLFRPFVRGHNDGKYRLKTFSASNNFPACAMAASVKQLKRLVVDYRTNYGTSTYSILWHTGLLYLANAVLHGEEDPEERLYFLLCITATNLYDVRTGYRRSSCRVYSP